MNCAANIIIKKNGEVVPKILQPIAVAMKESRWKFMEFTNIMNKDE